MVLVLLDSIIEVVEAEPKRGEASCEDHPGLPRIVNEDEPDDLKAKGQIKLLVIVCPYTCCLPAHLTCRAR